MKTIETTKNDPKNRCAQLVVTYVMRILRAYPDNWKHYDSARKLSVLHTVQDILKGSLALVADMISEIESAS
ncbi:hypothetical protein [Barnesiella intestinihominis]|uniref:hypothetical protein n=1 Tax=Barnesiella intestinihominis TaxID=487174 RepID=UPI00242ED714|nr:hypothetical protein [Barnesiella intestinihominis]